MEILTKTLPEHLESRSYFDSEILAINQEVSQKRLWLAIYDSSELMEEILGGKEKIRQYDFRYVFIQFEGVTNFNWELPTSEQPSKVGVPFLAINEKSLVIDNFEVVQKGNAIEVQLEFDRNRGTITFSSSKAEIADLELYSRQVENMHPLFSVKNGGLPIDETEMLKTYYENPDDLGVWVKAKS